MNVENNDPVDWNTMYGLELGFNCLATDAIRQQLQLTKYTNGDLEITEANLNPQYVANINDTVTFGFGPTVGLAKVDNGTDNDTVLTYGAGTSLTLNVAENIFVGADVKYEVTKDAILSHHH